MMRTREDPPAKRARVQGEEDLDEAEDAGDAEYDAHVEQEASVALAGSLASGRAPGGKTSGWKAGAPIPYSALAATFAEVEQTTKRLEILQYVIDLFVRVIRHGQDMPAEKRNENLLYTVYLCINRLCPDYEGLELGIGEGLLVKAIAQSTGREVARIKRDLEAKGDLGLVALASRQHQPTMFQMQALSVPAVFKGLREIALAAGTRSQDKKLGVIKRLLAACSGDESKYLIRSLEGKLRIGLAEKTVLVAVAHAVMLTRSPTARGEDPEAVAQRLEQGTRTVKAVYSELPSYDLVIPALLDGGVEGLRERCKLTPGIPLKPMLAKPTREIGEVLDRFEQRAFTCEFKYDGERAQVHGFPSKTGEMELRVFSRNSEDMSKKYPDLVVQVPRCLRPSVKSFVFDAEVVAWQPAGAGSDAGRLLPFQELARRKRKDVKAEDVQVSVKLFAFDLLYLNGEPLLQEELAQRRALLYEHMQPVQDEFDFATHRDATTTEEIQAFLDESVASGCEGLMVKMLRGPDATYEPSRRSINWLKLKKDYLSGTGDSLDLVVIGGYYGKGKRTNVYGAFLLACYDEDQEAYQSVCKIGTGFSEADLEAHHATLQPLEVPSRKGYYSVGEAKPDVYFEPRVVWEVRPRRSHDWNTDMPRCSPRTCPSGAHPYRAAPADRQPRVYRRAGIDRLARDLAALPALCPCVAAAWLTRTDVQASATTRRPKRARRPSRYAPCRAAHAHRRSRLCTARRQSPARAAAAATRRTTSGRRGRCAQPLVSCEVCHVAKMCNCATSPFTRCCGRAWPRASRRSPCT